MVEAKIEIEKEKAKNFAKISEIPVDFPYFKEEFKKLRDDYERLESRLSEIRNYGRIASYQDGIGKFEKRIQQSFARA